MTSAPLSPVAKSAQIPPRGPEMIILNDPKCRSTRVGLRAIYWRPTRRPFGSQRVTRIGSSGNVARLIASKFKCHLLKEECEVRAFEVAFLTPCRVPPRPGCLFEFGIGQEHSSLAKPPEPLALSFPALRSLCSIKMTGTRFFFAPIRMTGMSPRLAAS
jgi:hypothetical protein